MPSLSFWMSVSSIAVMILALYVVAFAAAEGAAAVAAANETAAEDRQDCINIQALTNPEDDNATAQEKIDTCMKTAKIAQNLKEDIATIFEYYGNKSQ